MNARSFVLILAAILAAPTFAKAPYIEAKPDPYLGRAMIDPMGMSAAKSAPAPVGVPLIPLWGLNAPQFTDHFYTTDNGQYNIALGYGFQDQGTVIYVEREPAPATSPLRRYYSSSLQAHYYAIDTSAGAPSTFNLEYYPGTTTPRVEGYLYPFQVPGSTPLYMLTDQAIGGTDYQMTASAGTVSWLVGQGWQLAGGCSGCPSGVVGYGYTTATPTVPAGIILGKRNTLPLSPGGSARGTTFGETLWQAPRPWWNPSAQTQVLSFQLVTYGMVGSSHHAALMMRAIYDWTQPIFPNDVYYWGVGVALGDMSGTVEPGSCGASGLGFQVEMFHNPPTLAGCSCAKAPDSNGSFGDPGTAGQCNVPSPLWSGNDGVVYQVQISANSLGLVDYRIWNQSYQLIAGGAAYMQGYPLFQLGLAPGSDTELGGEGIIFTSTAGNPQAWTAFFTNVNVQWY